MGPMLRQRSRGPRWALVLLLVALALACAGLAQAFDWETADPREVGVSQAKLDELGAYVAGTMRDLKAASAAALLVVRRGKIIYERYYGAHSFAQDARPTDALSRFPVFSITKTYCGVALMRLVEQGKMRLDDPVRKYIPEFTGTCGGKWNKDEVTIRHLASHSSGIPPDIQFVDVLKAPLKFRPGTRFEYSDPAVELLTEAMERASGMTIAQMIDQWIAQPLGLAGTGYVSPGDPEAMLVKLVRSGRDDLGQIYYDGPRGRGHSGLYLTARDLAAFGLLFLNEGSVGGVPLLSPLSLREMTWPQPPAGPGPSNGLRYGILLWLDDFRGSFLAAGWSHCHLVLIPHLELEVVVLRNRGGDPPGWDGGRDYVRIRDTAIAACVPPPTPPWRMPMPDLSLEELQ